MKGAFIFYGLSRILAFFTVGALLITALSLYSETGVTIYFFAYSGPCRYRFLPVLRAGESTSTANET